MGNGLIFAFVVALWAAYFVPLAVRRYDEASKAGSIEKFSSLSRVIPHKSHVDPHVDEADSESDVIETTEEETRQELATTHSPVQTSARKSGRKSARIAARRRRRTLITLILLAAIVGGVAGFGYIPLWSIAGPAALIVAWLIACRIQVRGELGIGRKAKSASTAADEEQTIVVSGQFEDIAPDRKHVMQDSVLDADALDDQIVIAVPVGTAGGEALWDPLPVTLPTYVTKPRAGRTVRTIEFGEPGAWTSGHIEGEDVEFPERKAEVQDEPRRAVGH
ncbi:MAG: divisome protein SepX/GlpR [Aeromicrobium sp.]